MTGSELGPEPAWLKTWPIAYPHIRKTWTVRQSSGTAWGVLTPEAGTVDVVDPTADKRLPGLAPALESGRLVGYRSGRRAVVKSARGYTKVLRPSRVDDVVAAHRRLAEANVAVEIPKVLQCSDDGRIRLGTLPGHSMHELFRASAKQKLSIPVENVAEALASLHQIDPGGDVALDDPPSTWATMVGRAEPDATECPLQLAERLPPLPPGNRALIHGDLHDKNILLCGQSVGLIDLDGVRVGIAEDELANLGVHLQLRCWQSGRPVAIGRAMASLLYRHYGELRPISPPRIDAAERHIWFRLACLYRFRKASRSLVPSLIRSAVGS